MIKFHKSHGKLVTVSAVHPGARFDLKLNSKVKTFKEKPQTEKGWINGGFCNGTTTKWGDTSILEREPLRKVANNGELMAYNHDAFGNAWTQREIKTD